MFYNFKNLMCLYVYASIYALKENVYDQKNKKR